MIALVSKYISSKRKKSRHSRSSKILRRYGVWCQKTRLANIKANIKVQPVIELLLFTKTQNLHLGQKYGASKFRGITQSHTKYRG